MDAGDPDDELNKIVIKRQPIRNSGIPGFAPNDKITTGNYAYLVSDEGVKTSALKTAVQIPNQSTLAETNRIKQLSNRAVDLKKISSQANV